MSSPLLLEQQPLFPMQSAWFSDGAFQGFPATQTYEHPTESPRSLQYDAAEARYTPNYLNQTHAVPSPQARTHPHRRALSNSTLASFNSSNSPYLQSQNLPNSAASAPTFDSPFYYDGSYEYSSNSNFPKNLPTPSRTPTNDAAGAERSVQPPSSDPSSQAGNLGAGLMSHPSWNNMSFPGQNPSQYHQNLPNTPRTASGDDRDEQQGAAYTSDVAGWEQDQSLFPVPASASQMPADMYTSAPMQGQRLSANQQMMAYHHQSLINQRLQDARSSASPGGSLDRQPSPFRQGSPYAAPGQNFNQPQTPIGPVPIARRPVKTEPDMAFNQNQPREEAQPKTISPKDAVLDYRPEVQDEAALPSLFPETSNASERSFDDQSYVQVPHDRRTNRSRFQVPTSSFSFVPPSMPASGSRASYSDFKFSQANALGSSEEPLDYPAHLVRMETSKSEQEPVSSQSHDESEVEKPAGTTADVGTYTCTYHGCTQRFRSPADLQRHKREGHRSGAQSTPSGRSDSPSSATGFKNSQAGPHRCDRINPSTGKPCNTIFSRPYDLTRHEDTIHNSVKKKVRCHLCSEEKTFSRSDALTRHMRVVHPEVDFPGKHRRRGGGLA